MSPQHRNSSSLLPFIATCHIILQQSAQHNQLMTAASPHLSPFVPHSENPVVGATMHFFIPFCVHVWFFMPYHSHLSVPLCQINPGIVVLTPCVSFLLKKSLIIIRKVFPPFAFPTFHQQAQLLLGDP